MSASAAPLPAGWTEYPDPSSGRSYYHNASTGETTWDRPGSAPTGGSAASAAAGAAQAQAGGGCAAGVAGLPAAMAAASAGMMPGQDGAAMAQSMVAAGMGGAFGADLYAGTGVAGAQAMGMDMYAGAGAGMAQGMAAGGMPGAPAYGMAGAGLDVASQLGGAMGFGAAGAAGAAPVQSLAGLKQGTVKVWFEDKGFGFLAQAEGGDDVFVHRNTLQDGQTLVQGATVSYIAEWAPQRGKFAVTKCMGALPGGGKPGTPPGPGALASSAAAPAAPAAAAPGASATSGVGTVKVWFDEKGFGFITPSGGGNDIFVHRNALQDGQMLVQGAQVSYSAEFSVSKNKMAVNQCRGAVERPGVAGVAAAAGMIGGAGAAGASRFSPYPGGAVAPQQTTMMGYGAL